MHLDPARIIEYLNEIISTFDRIDDNYDVFKLETKADASYIVVAGLRDRLHLASERRDSVIVRLYFVFHIDSIHFFSYILI